MDEPSPDQAHQEHLLLEAVTMALYVAVCLLAALTAVDEDVTDGHVRAFALVWGTTVGLALAHAFAFQLSARVAAGGRFRHRDAQSVLAQLGGAASVALLVSVPVIVLPASSESDAARLVLAGFIGGTGFLVARLSGRNHVRATIYGIVVLLLATVIAVVKNFLSHH